MNAYPNVLILGRTNVGKSALFNRLSDNFRSIVYDSEGITRDYIQDTISWKDRTFNIIDSGGIPLEKNKNSIDQAVYDSVMGLLDSCSLVVFVCDAKVGILDGDRRIAKIIHKSGKKAILIVNKVDNDLAEENLPTFIRLGFKDIIPASATHGRGVSDLLNHIVSNIPEKVDRKKTHEKKISIVGKPNVGKSSLMNHLVRSHRSIVSDVEVLLRQLTISPATDALSE